MKLFFTRDDSFYKICKTIEKLPKNKKVSLFMEPQNSFFRNPWRWKQVKNILEERNISYVFICKSERTRRYCEEAKLAYSYDQPNHFLRGLKLVYMFFFQAQKFHLSLFNKKTTLSYLFFIGEILIIGLIAYLLYQFILPSATIYVKPSYTVEDIVYNFRYYPSRNPEEIKERGFISIPYYTGSMDYTYILKTNTQNISFMQTPARWTVRVLNTMYQSFSLLPDTKLVTEDGMLFTMPESITIPAATRSGPGEVTATVIAMDKDEVNSIIGERGNIPVGTQLLIRNLPQSYNNQLLYAVASSDFTGWETRQKWAITQADLENIRQRMWNYVRANKKQIVLEEFAKWEDKYPLMFQNLIDVQVNDVTFDAQVGDEQTDVEGRIDITYIVRYFTRDNLKEALNEYLGQRPSQTLDIISMQKSSLTFFPDTSTLVTGDTVIVMPTKMSVIWWYDFNKDYNGIKEDMKNEIIGKRRDEVQKILLDYEEIGSILIKVSPPWSDTIPAIRSRVRFKLADE